MDNPESQRMVGYEGLPAKSVDLRMLDCEIEAMRKALETIAKWPWPAHLGGVQAARDTALDVLADWHHDNDPRTEAREQFYGEA